MAAEHVRRRRSSARASVGVLTLCGRLPDSTRISVPRSEICNRYLPPAPHSRCQDVCSQVAGGRGFQGRWRPRERYRRFHDPARACSLVGAIPWLADVGVGCLPGDPLRAAMMVARQSEAGPRLGVSGAQGPPGRNELRPVAKDTFSVMTYSVAKTRLGLPTPVGLVTAPVRPRSSGQ